MLNIRQEDRKIISWIQVKTASRDAVETVDILKWYWVSYVIRRTNKNLTKCMMIRSDQSGILLTRWQDDIVRVGEKNYIGEVQGRNNWKILGKIYYDSVASL